MILRLASISKFRGKYKVYLLLRKLGLLSGKIRHKVGDVPFLVPADQWDFWRICGPDQYAIQRLTRLAKIVGRTAKEFTLYDLGADVGTVSVQLSRMSPQITRFIAVEPNPRSFSYLETNFRQLRAPSKALQCAVSDFVGDANFSFDKTMQSDHSGHLDSSDGHSVRVTTIDTLSSSQDVNIILKIDVEGEEQNVIKGARKTIETCDEAILFLEIHPGVITRSGVSPEAIFAEAESIREFKWVSADEGCPQVDRSRKFFAQFSPDRQHDIIGVSI